VFDVQSSKRPPPFSIRLTGEERARLQAEAGTARLGTYIKEKALNAPPTKRAAAVGDRKALAQALALLGQSRIASNLNQLAHLGNIGALPLTPEIEEELREAFQHVGEIRALLLKATGIRKDA
jgi:hypothetical protein